MLAALLTLLAFAGFVVTGAGAPAARAAVPAGSEYPPSWVVTGQTATGTTPSGVVVTATLTGAAQFATPGALIRNGTQPSYIPTTTVEALSVAIGGCSNTAASGCGTITYSFSEPVMTPILYTTDMGASTGNPEWITFHDHPVTLTDGGTFSLESAGSQTPQMQIRNGGTTFGYTNPDANVGQPTAGQGTSCNTLAFGCGALLVNTPTQFVSSVSMGFGYDGTGTTLDAFSQVLGITPVDPELTLTKSADPAVFTEPGQQVDYSFVVENTGTVTITDVAIDETSFSGSGVLGAITCAETTLAAGATTTCTAAYTTTQEDVDAGVITNTAVATGTDPFDEPVQSNESPAEVTATQSPAVSLEKSADPAGPDDFVVGQEITYSFLVTNTGNVTLQDVAVDETEFSGSGSISAAVCPSGPVAPQEQVTCTATYTLTQADVDNGEVTNTATATGTPPTGEPPVSPPSTVEIPIEPAPAITIVKSSDTQEITEAGQVVEYSFLVTNTGNVTLEDVTVDETEFTGTGTAPVVECPAGAESLDPGEEVTCTATYTVTQADLDAGGSVTNTATATGTPPSGEPPVSPPSTVDIPTDPAPAITVVKSATPSDEESFVVGQEITYSFLVTNTGNVTLQDVAVDETEFSGSGSISAAVCPSGPVAPQEQVTCTATYTLTQADVDNGEVTNTATATGTPPTGEPPVSPPSTVTVPGDPQPAITVVKSSDTQEITEAGQVVEYSFLVTNTGNVTLEDVTIDETDFSGSGSISPAECPSGPVAPQEQVTCTASYTVTQADLDAGGELSNTATATGTPPSGEPPVSPPSTVDIPTDPAPAITVVKSSDTEEMAEAGQVVEYSFLVTNTGNVTLTDVTVDEGEFTGSGELSEIVCPEAAGSLTPGEEVTCTASYTVTQADVDNGGVTNTATATGTPPSGEPPVSPPSTVEIPADPAPGITVVKSATPSDEESYVVGQEIEYSFLVTNTGNVTLDDVVVDEGEFTGSGDLSEITCPADAASLAPQAQITCTATYTLTQADVDNGEITNTATATGTPPTGEPPVSPPSTVTVPGEPEPALDLVKTADRKTVDAVGQKVTYSFLVTNTGNVTIDDVTVDEGDFTGVGDLTPVTCPDAASSLAPGAQVTCTATYTVVAGDLTGGAAAILNTATATGTPEGGEPPVSPPSTARVTVVPGVAVSTGGYALTTDTGQIGVWAGFLGAGLLTGAAAIILNRRQQE